MYKIVHQSAQYQRNILITQLFIKLNIWQL